MRIYGDMGSGNCLKVKHTADALGLAFEWVPGDIMRGESRAPHCLSMSPMGQVPVVVLDDGRALAPSSAIIRFLARDTRLLPEDPCGQAKVDEWLFWEQNSHEFFVAGARFQMVYLGRAKDGRDQLRVERGEQALAFMDSVLKDRRYLAADSLTVADIALLAYTRVAGEGGFDLAMRPHVRTWIERCERDLGLAPVGTA